MKLVIIESPFKGRDWSKTKRYVGYLRLCMRDSLERGEAPYASHAMYTQPGVLNDQDVFERELGINAGFAWREVAEVTVVYQDFGITDGMHEGIADAEKRGTPVEYRAILDKLTQSEVDALLEKAQASFPE